MESNSEVRLIKRRLKEILKNKKLSYSQVAQKLDISEVTVKRFFTHADLSYLRLQQICEVAGTSAMNLMALINSEPEEIFTLTHDQELYLSKDETLMTVYSHLLKTRSLLQTKKQMNLGSSFEKQILELQRLDLIHPPIDDRVLAKHDGVWTWIKGGPLQQTHMRKRHLKYLDVFESQISGSYLASSQRRLSDGSLAEMKRDLEFIVQKFRTRAFQEENSLPNERLKDVAWLIGVGEK